MARRGPPPVPGPAPLPAPQPFPSRGSRRRRRRRRLPHVVATLALLVAPIGVAAAAYVGLGAEQDGRGSPALPLATGTPPARELVEQTAPREPSEPGPLVEGEPVPSIPLAGVDAFHVRLRKPPRAALVFDLDSGDVLWRRRPLRVLPMASLTKIMTALVVAQETRPDEPVRITKAALRYSGSGVGPRLHAVRVVTRARGTEPLLRARPGGADPDGDGKGADPPDRPPAPGGVPVPDQGRKAVPDGAQPADAAGLPGRGGAEDRLHDRGRPLLRGGGATRGPADGSGAAELARPLPACADPARQGVRAGARELGQVPAEVHLHAGDLAVLEAEDLGVAEAPAVGPRGLVGHEHLVTDLLESLELEGLDQLAVGPAALEVGHPVDAGVGGAEEGDLVGEEALDDAAIAGRVGVVAGARDVKAGGVGHAM